MQLRWDRATGHRAFLGGLGMLDRQPRLTLDVLLALHSILLPPSNPTRGRFRDHPIQIRFNGVTQWRPPDAARAVELTAQTLDRASDQVAAGLEGQDMKAAAAQALFEITDLHPFADGNGRVARCVASWMLTRGGYALLMDPGLYCHQRRDEYFRALDSKVLDPQPWRQFFDQLVAYCFRDSP